MTMTCNLGTEKMPIILDQTEGDANGSGRGVYRGADGGASRRDEDPTYGGKNYKDANARLSDGTLKSNLVKTCLTGKKQPAAAEEDDEEEESEEEDSDDDDDDDDDEEEEEEEDDGMKKFSPDVVATHFAYAGNELVFEEKGERGKGLGGRDGYVKGGKRRGRSAAETGRDGKEASGYGGAKEAGGEYYGYGDKRHGSVYMELSEFEGFGKEGKADDEDEDDVGEKGKHGFDQKLKCFRCFNCSFMSISLDSLNYHSQKKDKCFTNNETFHCPGCKNVFFTPTPLRVHLLHDHKMSQREVKVVMENVRGFEGNDANAHAAATGGGGGGKSSCAYESNDEIIPNGTLFAEDMAPEDGVGKGNFVQLTQSRVLSRGRELETCLSGKRQTMLESYLDDISNKGDCSLPPTLTQNGSDLLENTFNFTAPVSEQLPSIQPPPAHSSSNSLMEHSHLMMGQQGGHGFVGMANVFPEHRVEETYKGNEGGHYGGDSGGLMLPNGNYLPHQIHDIPVINLDENHLGKPAENILSQDINMDDFPSYHENGLPSLDGDDENGCRLTVEDEEQDEKKKLKKLGVGYRCDINGCKVRLQSEKNIQYHRRCHEGTLYNCPECCKDCSTWVSLSSHLWQAHKIDMELYKCDQCPYKTPSYSRLTNIHRGIHGKARPFLCDVCGKGFKTVKQMRNHKNIHKAKMVRMSVCHCEICGRTVADKRQLELHINNTHKKKKPYLCYMCGYASAVKHSLVVHMRRHTGEKPYECEKCDYKTADHNALRRHKMKHTGVRNYKCNHCSYTCIQASTYKVHIKTKHPGLETDVIFGCGQCSFQTLNRGSFLSHTSEHENYNAQVRKQARCQTSKQGEEYYGESNRIDLVGPIISERVVETIRDLSGAQTLLEDDYYERITGDLENGDEIKYKSSGIT